MILSKLILNLLEGRVAATATYLVNVHADTVIERLFQGTINDLLTLLKYVCYFGIMIAGAMLVFELFKLKRSRDQQGTVDITGLFITIFVILVLILMVTTNFFGALVTEAGLTTGYLSLFNII